MKRYIYGVSLIELVVALAIMAILLALALPQYTNYMRDVKVRAAAEALLSGIQLARSEAVRRNAPVEFLLTSSDPVTANVATATAAADGTGWMVRTADLAAFVEGKSGAEGGGGNGTLVRINDTGTPASDDPDPPPASPVASIVFDGLGRTNLATDAAFKFTSPQGTCVTVDGGTVRCLRVAVSVFGQARMCDPKVTNPDTRSC